MSSCSGLDWLSLNRTIWTWVLNYPMELGGLNSGYTMEDNTSFSSRIHQWKIVQLEGCGSLLSLPPFTIDCDKASLVQAKSSCSRVLIAMAMSCSADKIPWPCYLGFSSCILYAYSSVIWAILSFHFCFRDYNIIRIFYVLSFIPPNSPICPSLISFKFLGSFVTNCYCMHLCMHINIYS